MSEQPPSQPEPREPDVQQSEQPSDPEPLHVSPQTFDTIEKSDQHDYETRESEMETKDSTTDE